MGISRSWIERMIEQAARALAAIVLARRERRLDVASQLIEQTSVTLLGLPYDLLISLDPVALRGMLPRIEQRDVLARLCLEDAEILLEKGHADLAARRVKLARDHGSLRLKAMRSRVSSARSKATPPRARARITRTLPRSPTT